MIYLDNNATTFLAPEVQSLMEGYLRENLGNPSSLHRVGQRSRALLASALYEIAQYFQVEERELLLTSSATEALNTLLQGIPRGHIISSSMEHLALLEPLKRLEKLGYQVTYLDGKIDAEKVARAIRPETRLVALMAANNETGIRCDFEGIGELLNRFGIPYLVDGVALLGRENFKLLKTPSAFVFSSHKIHGPQGMGLAIIRKGFPFSPLILGGKQSYGRRGGTENLIGALGFAKALSLLSNKLPQAIEHMSKLRDFFEAEISSEIPDVIIHGKDQVRISNTSSISFPGISGEDLLIQLDLAGIAASHGSACSSGSMEISHVLLNMGIAPHEARSTLRFSLSRMTLESEIERAIEIVTKTVKNLYSSGTKTILV